MSSSYPHEPQAKPVLIRNDHLQFVKILFQQDFLKKIHHLEALFLHLLMTFHSVTLHMLR